MLKYKERIKCRILIDTSAPSVGKNQKRFWLFLMFQHLGLSKFVATDILHEIKLPSMIGL